MEAQMAAISVDYADLCGSGATGAAAFCALLEAETSTDNRCPNSKQSWI